MCHITPCLVLVGCVSYYTLCCTCRLWQCVTSHPVLYLQAVAVCYITPCVVLAGCGSVLHHTLCCICRLWQCARWWYRGLHQAKWHNSSGSMSNVTCRYCRECWGAALTTSSWCCIMSATWWLGHNVQVGTKIRLLVIGKHHVNLMASNYEVLFWKKDNSNTTRIIILYATHFKRISHVIAEWMLITIV